MAGYLRLAGGKSYWGNNGTGNLEENASVGREEVATGGRLSRQKASQGG